MLSVRWSESAIEDLANILGYVEQHNPQAAMRLGQLFAEAAERLPVWPLMFRAGRVPGTREYLVTSAYLLVYTVGDVIEIRRVLHTSQQYP